MEHENTIGESDEWYTPKWIFYKLDCHFDLDPCSPGTNHWVPAERLFIKDDDGLNQDWEDWFVFMNPPFGGRNGHVPWLKKFMNHRNGIAIVRAYTSAGWFHDLAIQADTMVFPRGKTKFIRPDGTEGKAPGSGIVLLGCGDKANDILKKCSIGFFVSNK